MSTQQLKNGGIIVNETNLSAATRYYPTDPNDGGRDVRRLAECVYRIAASGGVTITFEASMEDRGRDGIDAASVVWYDITDTVVQASDMTDGHASFADSTDVYRVNVSRWAKLRIVAVTSGTSNALRVTELGIPLGGSMSAEALATETTLAAAKAMLDAATHVGSSALEKSHVIKATPGTLRSVKALNTSGATLYLHVFDLTALPANGTAPDRTPIPIAAGDVNGDSWPGGTTMAVGCVAALSSTIATLTLAATSCGWFDAEVL